jgi:pseudaminic acid synthase
MSATRPEPDPIPVGPHHIGPGHPPFVVAEMSGNHNGSLERALRIVDAAAEAGAHAIKIQTYTAATMTLDVKEREFAITDPNSLWAGRSLYDLYEEAHTPWDWHAAIFERCRQRGIVGFSTPFDETAVDFLESLGAPLYKVASFENVDLPLIRRVARTGKPMVISTGLATAAEVDEAVTAAREAGARQLVVLKCTSAYPASPRDSHLRTIPHLRGLLGCQVGVSDHTMGLGAALAAVAMGATFIEKHFTLSRAEGGVDAAFSLEPSELRALVEESRVAWESLGEVHYGPTERERPSLQFRRSLYVAEDMQEGEAFTRRNLRAIRPGLGLSPKHLDTLLGRRVSRAVRKGTPASWDLLG